MAKYDQLLTGLKTILPSAQNIAVLLPAQVSGDELAAGLALYLSLQQSGKTVSVVSEGTIRVGHTNLFGVGEIKTALPTTSGDSFVISLGGVVTYDSQGKANIPALQDGLTWHPSGSDLELIFKVKSGHQFSPTHITPRSGGAGFGVVFIIGAASLNELGSLYMGNTQLFSSAHVVNIDNNQINQSFGHTNIVDPTSSSISEIMGLVIVALNLKFEGDIATNILSGIFTETNNLQSPKVTAETFEIISQALKNGGQKPGTAAPVSSEQTAFATAFNPSSQAPVGESQPPPQSSSPQPSANSFPWITGVVPGTTPPPDAFNFSAINSQSTPEPLNHGQNNFNFSQPLGGSREKIPEMQPSPEETPRGEGVESESPEPDWLTPKIYKGSSIG